jgi:hypothetical protein
MYIILAVPNMVYRMRKSALALAGLLFVLAGRAQNDPSRLDIGWLALDSGLTQVVTIKGADLEKMPFVNLSDAIAAWLYGAYTQPAGLQYIVDGNTVSDVNAYSVHDIEEVVLLQNAAAEAGTALGQQEIVVIRTKRYKDGQGIRVSGQSGLVNVSGYHPQARWYHDFYARASHNWGKVEAGVSANYLRDVFPDTLKTHMTGTTEELQRWRLNGYVDWRFNQRNMVELTLSYAPQRLDASWDSTYLPTDNRSSSAGRQRLVVPHVSWQSEVVPGLKNVFQATYLHGSFSMADRTLSGIAPYYGDYFDSTVFRERSYHFLVRDRLQYEGKIGHLDVEPMLTASYEYSRDSSSTFQMRGNETSSTGTGTRGNLGWISYSNWLVSKLLFLTPSVALSYKQAFAMQTGVLIEAGHQHGPGNRQGFPFMSLMLDPLRMGRQDRGTDLRLFGSYAQRTIATVYDYQLTDLIGGAAAVGPPLAAIAGYPINGVYANPGGALWPFVPGRPPVYWVWNAAAAFSVWKERLSIQYTFERRNYSTGIVTALPAGSGFSYGIYLAQVVSALHRVEVRAKLLDGAGLTWLSDLNMTLLRNVVDARNVQYYGVDAIGDVSPSAWSETGGWVNRIRVRRFSAGIDLLYHFGETTILPLPYLLEIKRGPTQNSLLVSNVYAGYDWKTRAGVLELFVESRGPVGSKSYVVPDNRRYYTIGASVVL